MSFLKNKTVTVFGGTGFIGQNIVSALIKQGAVVRVPSRLKNAAYNCRTGALVGQVVPMHVDFDDMKTVQKCLKGADYSINLIGILHETPRQKFDRIHADLAGRIAKHAKKAGIVQHIQMSALGADEAANSRYQRSKAKGETAVLKAFPTTTFLRPSIVFGEGDGFFARFAKMARFMPYIPLIGGGKTQFQPVYVGDIVEAVLAILTQGKSMGLEGAVIECAGPHTYSFETLMRYILDQTHLKRPLMSIPWPLAKAKAFVLEKMPGHILTRDQVRSLRVDNVVTGDHKVLDDLGIVPTPLEAIVPQYLESFRTGGQFAARS